MKKRALCPLSGVHLTIKPFCLQPLNFANETANETANKTANKLLLYSLVSHIVRDAIFRLIYLFFLD